MSELIVIGNGFDVTCGLKSTYWDFYKDRYVSSLNEYLIPFSGRITKLLEQPLNNIEENEILNDIVQNKLSFWDFIFVNHKLKTGNWQDVETLLAEQLDILPQLKLIYKMYNREEIDLQNLEIAKFSPTIKSDSSIDLWRLAKIFLIFVHFRYQGKEVLATDESISKLLLNELKMFEKEFCKYLSEEVHENLCYSKNSKKLLWLLEKYFTPEEAITYIMSFNYTEIAVASGETDYIFNNIHGQLSKQNIIFGTDITRHEKRNKRPNVKFFEDDFLKTFRTLYLPNYNRFYDNEVEIVKFYGHSLSDADYVYFQVIFDALNLFDSSGPKLVFFYSSYYDSEGKFVDELENQINRVEKLLLRYEDFLDSTVEKKPYPGYIFDKLRTQGRLSFVDLTEELQGLGMNTRK